MEQTKEQNETQEEKSKRLHRERQQRWHAKQMQNNPIMKSTGLPYKQHQSKKNREHFLLQQKKLFLISFTKAQQYQHPDVASVEVVTDPTSDLCRVCVLNGDVKHK